jgi:hypothetical protein
MIRVFIDIFSLGDLGLWKVWQKEKKVFITLKVDKK